LPVRDLSLLHDAALEAGQIAMHYFKSDVTTWDKGDGQGPVSEADLAIDQMLLKQLRAARPDYGWLSEETEDDPERLNHETVFIVDPIDGTRSFINGHENFATSIAVAQNGVVTAAAVHLPAKGLTYLAALGQAATLNGDPIHHNGRTDVCGARIFYRMCLVACGRFDGMITLRPTWEWDVAGGDLICREAGATVTDMTGSATKYNSQSARLNGMVVATPGVHNGVLEYL